VFVPLAALCSFVGLLRGLVGMSVGGIAVSLLGGLLTLCGFITSPSLGLLAGYALIDSAKSTPSSRDALAADRGMPAPIEVVNASAVPAPPKATQQAAAAAPPSTAAVAAVRTATTDASKQEGAAGNETQADADKAALIIKSKLMMRGKIRSKTSYFEKSFNLEPLAELQWRAEFSAPNGDF
jgi:hypothetical protein